MTMRPIKPISSIRYIKPTETEISVEYADGKIYTMDYPSHTYHDANVDFWISEGNAIAEYALSSYKQDKLKSLQGDREIAASADITVNVGGTDYTFAADQFSRNLSANVVVALNTGLTFPANFKWTTADNQLLTLSEAQAKLLAKLMLEQEYLAQRDYWNLKAIVDDPVTDTRAKVDAIVWT